MIYFLNSRNVRNCKPSKATWQNMISFKKHTSPQRYCVLLHITDVHASRQKKSVCPVPVRNPDFSAFFLSALHTSADDASLITAQIVRSLALELFPTAFKAPSIRTETQGYLQAVLQKSRLGCNWSVNYCTPQQTVLHKTEAARWKINKSYVYVHAKKDQLVAGAARRHGVRAAASSQIQSRCKITTSDYESTRDPLHDSTHDKFCCGRRQYSIMKLKGFERRDLQQST